MTVNRSRFHAFNRPWMWIAAFFLGLFWIGQLFVGFGSYHDGSFEEDVRLRYLDREMLLLDAGQKGNRFQDWWTGRSDLERQLSELESLIPDEDYRWESWDGEYGVSALRNILARHRGGELEPPDWPDEWPREEVRNSLLSEENPAFIAKLYLDEGEDPEVRALYEKQANSLLHRSYCVSGLRILFLLGLPFVFGHVFSKPNKIRPRFPSLWSPALLMTVFFGAAILASYIHDTITVPIHFLPEDVYWPWTVADFLWRALPSLFMGLLLFQSFPAFWRTFGLDRPIAWRCLLFAMGINVTYNWILYYAGGTGEVDPDDYFYYPDPNAFDLFDDFLSGVIAAPIFEEIVFRGFLFLGLQKRIGMGWAALISSVLFGVIHIQYDLLSILGVTIFGLICTWLTWRTQSIKTAIILHAVGNLLIMIDVFLYYQMPLI